MAKKKKRRTELDIKGRKQAVDVSVKKVEDGERFKDSIVEKKSKLQKDNHEEPATSSGLYSSKKTHRKANKKEQAADRQGISEELDLKDNRSGNETDVKAINKTTTSEATESPKEEDKPKPQANKKASRKLSGVIALEESKQSNKSLNTKPMDDGFKEVESILSSSQKADELAKKTTDSTDVKGNMKHTKDLNINKRKASSSVGDKRVEESKRFQDSIHKKRSKLQESKKDKPLNHDESSLSSSKPKKKQKQQSQKSQGEKLQSETPCADKDINDSVTEVSYVEGSEKISAIQKSKTSKKQVMLEASKKKKDGKLTTDDVRVSKDKANEKESLLKPKHEFKFEELSDEAKEKYLKSEAKLIQKRKRAGKLYHKPKHTKTAKAMGSVSTTSMLASEYMSVGSEDNVAVKSVDQGLAKASSLARHKQGRLLKQRRNPLKDKEKFALKHKKNMARAEYKTKLKELQTSSSYQKKNAYKKLIKRKQMKKKIYQDHKIAIGFKERLKKESINILKGSSKLVKRNIKGILAAVGLVLVGFMIISQLASMFLGGISSVTTQVISTTYLSSEENLSYINQEFSSFEYALEDELANVESHHPGYDEYEIHKDGEIGHDVHVLLSYVTARYGEVKDVSSISYDLANLFNEMYQVSYKTVVETRYRWVCYDDGEEETCGYESYDWYKLVVRLHKKELDTLARNKFQGYEDNLAHYEMLLESKGNMEAYFGSGSLSEIVSNPDFGNPGIAFSDSDTKDLFNEAEKHIGKRYVFGGNGPANFDCSSFVCWSFTHSGIKNMPRTTAEMIYRNYCTPISASEAKAGDIIFFTGTYNSGTPISHVGIYAGNGMMIHAGDPIQYTSINSNYWKQHFYAFGRPR